MTSHNLNAAGSCFRGAGLFVRAWPRWLLTTTTVFHLRSVVARSQARLVLRCAGICLLSPVLVLCSCWSVHGGLGFWSSFEDRRQCSEMAQGLYFPPPPPPPSPKFSESEITECMHSMLNCYAQEAGGPRLILSWIRPHPGNGACEEQERAESQQSVVALLDWEGVCSNWRPSVPQDSAVYVYVGSMIQYNCFYIFCV
ncbi:hypothetical protein IW262DRAFT_1334277 [Armillaria fumosa]|nr:hypothetical protein IW262DRAFT_1334277 [Armillaria fumosa]